MSSWTDKCFVAEIVRHQVSEEFYNEYSGAIQSYFDDKEDFDETAIFAYCLGLSLRDEVEMEFEPPFCDFCQYVFDGWGIPL